MAITIIETKPPVEEHVVITDINARTIRNVAEKVGKVEAIVVTRWLTKCGIKTAKDFVESLCEREIG